MNTELIITLAILALELFVLGWCFIRSRRPPDPRKPPRILPYGLITIFLTLAVLVTLAHTIGVITGHKVEGRTKMKGQR